MALGHTLFARAANGQPVRVSDHHAFAEGDAVRLVVESNCDGFLYVFDREGDGPLRLVFPDLRIGKGEAEIYAHTPVVLPEPGAVPGGGPQWFVFSGLAKAEQLYLILSKKPVQAWPRGQELLAYPSGFEVTWRNFRAQTRVNAQTLQRQNLSDIGQALSKTEQDCLQRGLTLSRHDPSPSVIEATSIRSALLLVSVLSLRRK